MSKIRYGSLSWGLYPISDIQLKADTWLYWTNFLALVVSNPHKITFIRQKLLLVPNSVCLKGPFKSMSPGWGEGDQAK